MHGCGANPGVLMIRRLLLIFLALAILAPGPAALARPVLPVPPEQPATGPGGRAGTYSEVAAQRYGSPPKGFWLFTPEEPVGEPAPEGVALPVVLFLHGFTAVDPRAYRTWIDHIVRRGAVVIYPDYQTMDPFGTPWSEMLPNVLDATRDALARIDATPEIDADTSRLAVAGHSLGGVLAVSFAAVARDAGLPETPMVVALQPGGCAGCPGIPRGFGLEMPDLAGIPVETRLLVIVAENDSIVGDGAARVIWDRVPHVPLERRDYVIFREDDRGIPRLAAGHSLAQTGPLGGVEDSFDWFGTWKLFDLLADCTFRGTGCEDALGDTRIQRDMGAWSDGQPVRQPIITNTPMPPDQFGT
jgi:dienelactone hydrolase